MKSSKFPVNIVVILAVALLFGVAMGMVIISNTPSNPPSAIVSGSGSTRTRVGQIAPDFTLNTLAGEPIKLSALRGKRVLVNFWASWCAPCKEEIPALQQAYDQLHASASDVVFIGIGYQDKTDYLKSFVQANKMTYTIVEDAAGTTGDAYNVLGMPTTFFIDSSGVLQHVETGVLTRAEVLKQFEQLK